MEGPVFQQAQIFPEPFKGGDFDRLCPSNSHRESLVACVGRIDDTKDRGEENRFAAVLLDERQIFHQGENPTQHPWSVWNNLNAFVSRLACEFDFFTFLSIADDALHFCLPAAVEELEHNQFEDPAQLCILFSVGVVNDHVVDALEHRQTNLSA